MTTQEKVQELCKDFLQRNGDNFTSIRRSNRIGWEDTMSQETAYSAKFLNLSDKIDVFKVAYSHAKDVVTSMNPPFKVKIVLNPNASCTDSKEVHVATSMFDDKTLSLGKQFDIFTGLAVHESCHLLYTDFKLMPQSRNRVVANLFNVIEDERIEMLCGEERPGFANFLSSTKQYYFDAIIEPQSGQNEISRLFNTILGLIRYPSSLSPSEVEYFADTLLEVRDVIVPYPRTSQEAFDAANKIYDIIKSYVNQENEQQPEMEDDNNDSQSQGQGGSGSQEGNSNSDSDKDGQEQTNQGDSGKSGSSSETQSKENQEGSEQSEAECDNSKSQSQSQEQNDSNSQEENRSNDSNKVKQGQTSQNNSKQSNKELSDAEIEELLSQLDAIEKLSEKQQETSKDLDDRTTQIVYGNITQGMTDNVDVYKVATRKENYLDVLSTIKPYIPAVSSVLRKKGTQRINDLRGLRSGRLDTGKIAEAVQGKDTVYRQETIRKSDEINVCILIDQSGSMCGNRIMAAQQTAILLNEALSSINGVKLYVYGHTTCDNKIVLFSYKENASDDKYKLGNMNAYNGNIDSQAIKEVCKRVRSKTPGDCLMFVISDGRPCEDMNITREAVRDAQKKGFNVIGIGISAGLDDLKTIYNQYIQITDLQRLAPELGKLTKKQVMKR